ncbi:MAG: vWA domain-containing protein, partial [Promethearchaeota archaeon]
IDLAKYVGRVIDLEKANLAFETDSPSTSAELMAYVHLHYDDIISKLDSMFLGRGTILNFAGPMQLKIHLANSQPILNQGQIGVLSQNRINLNPAQMHRAANVLLCISTDSSMQEKDIELRAMESIRRGFMDIKEDIGELQTFLNAVPDNPTRSQIIALAALMVLNSLSSNRTDGRFALVTFSDQARKFSVQKNERVLNFVEFASDFSSKEVMASLVYSILDTVDDTGGKLKAASAYRSIAELLEEFGRDRPTLVILLTSTIVDESDESEPFIRAIAQMSGYQLDVFSFDRNVNIEKAKTALRGLNARILPVRSFSGHIFDGYILDAFSHLLEGASDVTTEHDLEGSQ